MFRSRTIPTKIPGPVAHVFFLFCGMSGVEPCLLRAVWHHLLLESAWRTGYLILGAPTLPSPAALKRATCSLIPWLVQFARARTVMVTGIFAFWFQRRPSWIFWVSVFWQWTDIFQMIADRFQHFWSFPGRGAAIRDVWRWLWGDLSNKSPCCVCRLKLHADSACKLTRSHSYSYRARCGDQVLRNTVDPRPFELG